MDHNMRILVTGGAGFIGCNLINQLLKKNPYVLNVDKLTYSSNQLCIQKFSSNKNYHFQKMDIIDELGIRKLMSEFNPKVIFHLAAESHVDRSIFGPNAFIKSNIVGTFNLLESCREYWNLLPRDEQHTFRFIHISTDEVYGDLGQNDPSFTEETPYHPSSPYSASKASSDHLARAWFRTYGLPIIVTNCSNNFGPYQHAEKLIPQTIINALKGKTIPVYGDGQQIRDWLYVADHCEALIRIAEAGTVGDTYNIGGGNEMNNLAIVQNICHKISQRAAQSTPHHNDCKKLIKFVADRPGHDTRYSINSFKLQTNWVGVLKQISKKH